MLKKMLRNNKRVLIPQGKPWTLWAHEASLEVLNLLISALARKLKRLPFISLASLDNNFAQLILLIIGSVLYFSFGLYHLTKFETVDEHFWKYERIPQYWYEGILNKNPKKTYINDKPGVATAVISGLGLIFQPHPEEHRIRESQITNSNTYTLYKTNETEKINFALRFPLLLFNGLFAFFFFWIIKKITDEPWVATLTFLAIVLSPVLIGISQIINPDTLLWTFTAAAIFSYFALLKTSEKKFVLLTTLFTGLSLLSKYTANILFPLFLLTFFTNYVLNIKDIEEKIGTKKYFLRQIGFFFAVAFGSAAIYSFFMPAVFIKTKYLYEATIGFSGLKLLLIPISIFIALLIFDSIIFKGKNILKISSFLNKYSQIIVRLTCFILFTIFSIIILNSLTGQKFIPFDILREQAYTNDVMDFGGLLANDQTLLRIFKELLVQFYPFVFSILPLVLFLLLFLWAKIFIKGQQRNILYIFILSLFSLIYFSGSLLSGVLTNIRYSIMLYPLYAFLGAVAMSELIELIPIAKKRLSVSYLISSIILIIFSFIALNESKPFYFNYTSFLLPNNHTITDSWGYGAYEAAQYLNALPDAENKVVWADRNGICQFLKGKCLTQYKIDLSKNIPDYFIISKRGSVRHPFAWKDESLAKKSVSQYYQDLDKNFEWNLYIDNRPDNFIKIVKSQEKQP